MKRDAFTMPLDQVTLVHESPQCAGHSKPLRDPRERTRSIWRGMHARCTNERNISYPGYGGRGITVCARWADFGAFYEDMGAAPAGMTLERKDGTLPYQSGNCVWATPKEQARNRSNNVLVEYQGVRRPITEWAELHGMAPGTLWRRLQRGILMETALTRALHRGKPLSGKQKPRRNAA